MTHLWKCSVFVLFNAGILALGLDSAKNPTSDLKTYPVLYYQPEQVHISIGGKLATQTPNLVSKIKCKLNTLFYHCNA